MSTVDPEDPRCPECGEPIGATAVYCMHCSTDLTGERELTDIKDGGARKATGDAADESDTDGQSPSTATSDTVDISTDEDGSLLDPDGILDNTLTVVVGLGGGLIVGFIGTLVLAFMIESVWAFPAGILVWLLATIYLVRQHTVQGAVAKAAYGVALVLVLVPLIAFSPGNGGNLAERFTEFGGLLFIVAIPAGIAGGIGFLVSRFVPESQREG